MPRDWDWSGPDETKSTVIRPVEAVAVYTNLSGDLVIRQQHSMGDDDSVIVVPISSAEAIISAIRKELGDE